MNTDHLNILIVDDNGLSRKLLTVQLTTFGFQEQHIMTCTNGPSALDILGQKHFDIVVLDWDMPKMSGLELWNIYKTDYNGNAANTAFIMISAEAQPERILEAINAGITSYITKPVSQADINEKMPKILEWLEARAS